MKYKLLRQNIRRILLESDMLDEETLEKISALLQADNKNAKTNNFVDPQSFEFIRAFGMNPETFDRHIDDIETFQALLRLCIIPIFLDAERISTIPDPTRGSDGRLEVSFPLAKDKRKNYFYVKFNYENKTMEIVCGIHLYKRHWLANRDSRGRLLGSRSQEIWPVLDDSHPSYPAPEGEVPLDLKAIIKYANDFREIIDQNLPPVKDQNRTRKMPYF